MRRQRLAQLIREKYGSQANFIEQTNENQGEVSALLKNKSFGEKKARNIEEKCGLTPYWLDGNMAPLNASPQAREIARVFDTLTPDQQTAVIGVINSYGAKVERIEGGENIRIEQPATKSGAGFSKNLLGQKESFGSS